VADMNKKENIYHLDSGIIDFNKIVDISMNINNNIFFKKQYSKK
jgi:hypothetical protein